jgi:SnoaL-like domain
VDPLRLVDELRRAIEAHDADRVASFLHPDVELRLYSATTVIAGRDDAQAWYRRAFESRTVFEGDAQVETASDGAFIMRGRLRWYDQDGLRDRPGQWRITFRDGLIATITAQRGTETTDLPHTQPGS